ncbi:MAG: hypothetical protein DRP30_03305 [Thermotoga sp.]|nr:MAG: hypothetical protein DRP30_03305 [Thermotoga sp.]
MRNLRILLKYGLKGTSTIQYGKSSKRGRMNPLLGAAMSFGFLGFMVFTYISSILSKLKDVYVGEINMAEFFTGLWSLYITVMFFMTFIPYLVYSFFKNEEIEFLLSLPVERWEIIFYQSIITFVNQAFIIAFNIFTLTAYAKVMGYPIYIAMISSILHVFACFLLAMLVAIVLKGFMGATTSKRMSFIVNLSMIVVFILLGQFSEKAENVEKFLMKLERTSKFLFSPFNILSFQIFSLENPLFLLPMICVILIVFPLLNSLSRNMSFEMNISGKSGKRRVGRKEMGGGLIKNPVYLKDFKSFIRQEQISFMFLYPFLFSLLMGIFAFSNVLGSMMIFIVISSFYTALISAFLLSLEFQSWPFPKSLPLNDSEMILPKVMIPTVLNTLSFSGILLIFRILGRVSSIDMILIPVLFLLEFFSACLGVREFMKNPVRGGIVNINRALGFVKVIMIEGITIGLAVVTTIPLYFMLHGERIFKSEFWDTMGKVAGFVGISIAIILSRRLFVSTLREYRTAE